MDASQAKEFRQKLVTISDIILNNASSHGELLHHTHDLFKELETISSVEAFRHLPVAPVILSSGKAIDPFSAAHCLVDYARTTKFMRGLYLAVLEAKSRFKTLPVHIFYAGTGPYAALMLPLTTRFSPDEIQFSMVEVHPTTFDMLKETMHKLGLSDYIKNYILKDACQLTLADYGEVHIVISETMQVTLKKEPQVSITYHLASQLVDGGIFIPERVHVWAGLTKPSQAENFSGALNSGYLDSIKPLATLMDLDPYNLNESIDPFPEIHISIPADVSADYRYLKLFTEIVIFGDVKLTMNESGLTIPKQILIFNEDQKSIDEIKFQYIIDEESTGFKISY